MNEEDAIGIIQALNRIARSTGDANCQEGDVATQIAKLGNATEKVADALDRIADAISDKEV